MSIVSDQVRLYEPFIAKFFLFKKDENVVTKIALFFYVLHGQNVNVLSCEMFWWWLGRTKH